MLPDQGLALSLSGKLGLCVGLAVQHAADISEPTDFVARRFSCRPIFGSGRRCKLYDYAHAAHWVSFEAGEPRDGENGRSDAVSVYDVTRTSTDIPKKALVIPTKLPATGIACRMSRVMATGIAIGAADAAVRRIEGNPARARHKDFRQAMVHSASAGLTMLWSAW